MGQESPIKQLRERLGLTQRALADELGVHPNTVARWERGKLGISSAMEERLERVVSSGRARTAVKRSSAVTLDPHHADILDALNGKLDPDVFEACAVALLGREHPTLVPVRGGGDDGFDGAVANAEGEPFPLIATIGARPVRNLTHSLERAKQKGWDIAKALFATPRRITPATRSSLFKAARERDVTLVQTCDQDWFAQNLYQEPEWCKRLLGVTGRPSALSLFPLTQRPVLGDAVLGREQEMRWLIEQKGDCLLTGEPGSGKTFLLRSLALQGHARFLVDGDRTQIANDLRTLRPPAVIVDDAHVNPEQITELMQIRSDVGAEFRIIATSWPKISDPIRNALQIGSVAELELCRLDADTMVEIIKSSGVWGPDRLLYAIRKQSAGRPGLAATLGHLCVTGNVEEVFKGESLLREISGAFHKLIGDEALILLAPFALGGTAGVKQDLVFRTLGEPSLHCYRVLATIGAAGVISQRDNRVIAVEPEPLRWGIVKRVFYDGPTTLDINAFLSIVENREDTIKTLIGVRYRGASVPELEECLERESSVDLWSAYASLGAAEARYVLRRHPGILMDIAQSVLNSAPETAIPMLLERVGAEDETTRKASAGRLPQIGSESPLDQLKTWAKAISSEGERVLERRLAILRGTISWSKGGGNRRSAIRALCIALQPGLEYATLDPGIGNTYRHVSRILRGDELSKLTEHWPDVLDVVKSTKAPPWSELIGLVEAWRAPQSTVFPRVTPDENIDQTLRNFTKTMVRGLAKCSRQHPGVQHRIDQLINHLSFSLDLNLDPLFEILCPSERTMRTDLKSRSRQWSNSTEDLADHWKSRSADDIALLLSWFEEEANFAGIKHPRLSGMFCSHLAERVPNPLAVADAAVRRELPSALLAPFLRRVAAEDQRGWSTLAFRCLGHERYRCTAVETVLTHRAPPRQLLIDAMSKAAEIPNLDDFIAASCRSIPEATINEMLRSNDDRVAVTSAVGYWLAYEGEIPAGIRSPWRQAVLRSASAGPIRGSDDHWLGEILSQDCGLASEWLVWNLTDIGTSARWTTWDLAKKAAGILSVDERESVLERVDAAGTSYVISEVMKMLVGGNLSLYTTLLHSKSLKGHHLDPLEGRPDKKWREMALVALNHGYSTESVANATVGRGWSFFGSESEMWLGRRQPFEALRDDPDFRIAEIGLVGVEYTTARLEDAVARERQEAVEGLR